MLAIRLRRTGKKGQPLYRIVVADERNSASGKYIEMIGHFNPQTKAVVMDSEKAMDWLKKGAKPSNTVAKILTKQNLKHKSIVIKIFRAVSKTELEKQKTEEEKARAEEAAKKEAAKVAFEQQVEAEKEAAPKEDKLQEIAKESIEKIKEEKVQKTEATEIKPSEDKVEEKKES